MRRDNPEAMAYPAQALSARPSISIARNDVFSVLGVAGSLDSRRDTPPDTRGLGFDIILQACKLVLLIP